MSVHTTGSFVLDLDDLDASVFPVGSRLQHSKGFDEALREFVERVFESWDGFSEFSRRPGTQKVQVRYSLRQDIATVRDAILRTHHVDAETVQGASPATLYEQLEMLRFLMRNDRAVHCALAELAIKRRDFCRALDLVSALLSQDGQDQSARFLQGRALLGFGRIADARESFAVAFQRVDTSTSIDAGMQLIRIMLWEERETRDIEKLLRAVLEIAPRHPEALFIIAMIRFSQGRTEEGESILQEIVRSEESPPIGEYAWKAWVELNRRLSPRLRVEFPFLDVLRLRDRVRKHFSPLSSMKEPNLRDVGWQLFKDFHSISGRDSDKTFYLPELAADVGIDDVLSIMWIVFSMLAPEREIGLEQTKELSVLLRVISEKQLLAGRTVFRLVELV